MRTAIVHAVASAAVAAAFAVPAQAGEAAIAVTGGQRTVAHYACDDHAARDVTYINGDGQSFAIVPVGGAALVFVDVLSGSGARYVAGQYVWWTKGPEATLYDLMRGENGKPLATCREAG